MSGLCGILAASLLLWAATRNCRTKIRATRLLVLMPDAPKSECSNSRSKPSLSSRFTLGWCNQRARGRSIQNELPATADLLRIALAGGSNVRGAIELATRYGEGVIAGELQGALDMAQNGRRLCESLELVAGRNGNALQPLLMLLASTDRNGGPVVSVLERLSKEGRDAAQLRAEIAARRLSVELLFPVAVCTLPAFVLLAVAPLLAGSLAGLAASFS